jgi:hypothetical protein
MKKALIGTAVVVVVIAGAYFTLLSDEPPIRVRNGSIALHAGLLNGTQWEWKDQGNGYDHEPGEAVSFTWKFWVRVDPGAGSYSCDKNPAIGDADKVELTFLSDGSERKITFDRVGPFWKVRTKVQPKPLLNLDGNTTLKSIGEGYVTKVVVGGLTCTFAAKDSLEAINICTSDNDESCKPR